VLVTDAPWGSTVREEKELADVGARVVLSPSADEDELVTLARDADAILTCFAQVTPVVVAAAERLQVIGRYGTGTDNIAVEDATARDIPVTNVPVYCTDEVVEQVLGMLLCLARSLHRYDRAVRRGDWGLDAGTSIHRVAGRTLGIIGFGAIGSELARRARALGLHVIVHGRRPEPIEAAGIEAVALDELAARSDFVSLHVPLLESTRGIVGRRFLSAMRPTAYLINAARGGLVDHDALAAALASGAIAGAGLDVFEPERLPPGHPLLGEERLIATPHTAFYSEESMADLAVLAARNVADVLAGRRPAALVNPAVLERKRWSHLT
jgi:D-3-phosphoglycerate dehydrogenase / 2-oxoglutarate reductase